MEDPKSQDPKSQDPESQDSKMEDPSSLWRGVRLNGTNHIDLYDNADAPCLKVRFHKDNLIERTQQTDPVMMLGARISLAQLEEYLYICNPSLPRRELPPPKDPNYRFMLYRTDADASVYATRDDCYASAYPGVAFEGLGRKTVLGWLAREFAGHCWLDAKGYAYLGITIFKTAEEECLAIKYDHMHRISFSGMEMIQRILCRIPLQDDRLDANSRNELAKIRDGTRHMNPAYYLFRPVVEFF